jgi:hypothetical protein
MESPKKSIEISKTEIHFSEKLSTIRIAEHFKLNYSSKLTQRINYALFLTKSK